MPLPALHATHAGIWIAANGEVREASRSEAIKRLAETPHVLLNAPLVGQRLGTAEVSGLDLLELFAFVHPARFAVPTVAGMCRAVGIAPPAEERDCAAALLAIAGALLDHLGSPEWREREGAWTANGTLYRLGWSWAPFVAERVAKPERGERMLFARLPQWEEQAERPPPRTINIAGAEAEAKLAELTGPKAEPRLGQRAMA
ncbi:MAG: ATP-dependent DNA helicase, partial [Sphingomonas bacterium]|nr:ATP-dependent DNA helicase [Sphingomonas bacterium]